MALSGNVEGKGVVGAITKLLELRGYSAYEVAVLNGFSGTEEAWLESLKGKKGDSGTPPHIGENENWWIGEEDTGVSAVVDEQRLSDLEKDVADLKYKPISISQFQVLPGVQEMGSAINEVILSWSFSKSPVSVMLDGAAIDASLSQLHLTQQNLTETKTYTLQATDERGASASKTATIHFYNGVYYGADAIPDALDSAFVLKLTKTLRNSKLPSFQVNAGTGDYIWYALPVRLGECTFKVGGFEGGFTLIGTMTFTNEPGYSEEYRIYRSDNASLGNTAVEVS